MKKILFATAGSMAFLSATPAFAQEVAAPVGPRVEAVVGYDKVKAGGEHDGGALFGIGAGYDFAVAPAVSLGVDVEATESTMKEGDEDIAEVKAGRDLYAGLRASVAVSPSANLYVKGGYTNQRYSLTGTDGTTTIDGKLDTDGWRAGAGIEKQVSGNAYIGAEYRYSKYGEGEVDFEGATPDGSRFNLDTDRHQVVATAGIRF